jgi:uncharacterized protein
MTEPVENYDRRYLAGIVCFNERDFFEAHEVWENLWMETAGPERRFYQGLIQAAVALFHFGNGNVRGARKLYSSGRAYMEPFGSPHLGLDCAGFWRQMERCLAEILANPDADRSVQLDEALLPVISLDPPPSAWPDPAEFLRDED